MLGSPSRLIVRAPPHQQILAAWSAAVLRSVSSLVPGTRSTKWSNSVLVNESSSHRALEHLIAAWSPAATVRGLVPSYDSGKRTSKRSHRGNICVGGSVLWGRSGGAAKMLQCGSVCLACAGEKVRSLCSSAQDESIDQDHQDEWTRGEDEGRREGRGKVFQEREQVSEEYQPVAASEILKFTMLIMQKRRAMNVKVLNADQYSVMKPLCEHMVIATFKNRIQMLIASRHVKQAADKRNVRTLKASRSISGNPVKWRLSHIEAEQSDRWMLVDMGSVVFHAFSPEGRTYYDLDGHWVDAQKAHESEQITHEEFIRRKRYSYKKT